MKRSAGVSSGSTAMLFEAKAAPAQGKGPAIDSSKVELKLKLGLAALHAGIAQIEKAKEVSQETLEIRMSV